MKCTLILFCLLAGLTTAAQQHPVAFATKQDFALVKSSLPSNIILQQSFSETKNAVDKWLDKDIDVPLPKDAAGGYTHEKHKDNYTLMFNSGQLYQITGEAKYALLVKKLLLKYAALNPTLKNHPQATSTSPGRLFWQALNDANWLMYTGLAYDCVQPYLTAEERKTITGGAFKPEVDYFTHDLKDWFNLIHNHAVWACAGVGVVGIATDNEDDVQMALYGSNKDGKAGLLAQMDGLFSPDGYYNEGPYYTRYAVLPFYIFANAINNTKPQLKIFEHRNNILQKALNGALQQTNLNGGFFSYNDALKDKTFVSNEVVVALSIAWQAYGADAGYLPIAKAQGRVVLNRGGVAIGKALATQKNIPSFYPYKPVEFTDGANGKNGGVAIMRQGKDNNLTSLIFKYSSHGLSHGHYDKLNINLYDNGNEILQDYGAARFIGIEQKYGGRYLPETRDYAQQTIAHNTITVDETSHFKGVEKESEKYHPTKVFGNLNGKSVQVISAVDDKAYNNITLHRSIFMLQLPGFTKPLIVDFFRTLSAEAHQYDLPFNYVGSVISTNFKYTANTKTQTTLGKKNGYQFLWSEAKAKVAAGLSQFTFLNGKSFYTISALIQDSADVFFTRTGAGDPDFNLRSETSYILRAHGTNRTFINLIEMHGNYSSVAEVAGDAYSAVASIEKIRDDEEFTAAVFTIKNKPLLVIQCNKNFDDKTVRHFAAGNINVTFKGSHYVSYNGEIIQ